MIKEETHRSTFAISGCSPVSADIGDEDGLCSVVIDKRWHVNGRIENEKRQSSDNLKSATGLLLDWDRTRASNYARDTEDKYSRSRDGKSVDG